MLIQREEGVTCRPRGFVHLVCPSILAHSAGQLFSSSTSESSLKLEGNADWQLFGSTRKPSVHIAINVLSVM